ncbi:hypothetical protein O7634_27885 [Micromonospora sp. WMMD1120]|uniref:hypothetical protein n=1 Tax=Micromonospora sp. WMMD1120 TaxID=3016106 RepID=UPI0024173860|nr:hypothetical protein [Micromonospora sp. WMMD1120]MDG4810593.1 hypothetical protein [Micromonospora sp. WMMD1120]
MTDPIMVTAATTLVAWATTELAQSGQAAVSSLIAYLRTRFQHEPASRAVIESALQQSSPEAVSRLAELLDRESHRDVAFGAELRARWSQVEAAVGEGAGGVANSVSGDVHGSVVQARDVHGGIHLGDRPAGR